MPPRICSGNGASQPAYSPGFFIYLSPIVSLAGALRNSAVTLTGRTCPWNTFAIWRVPELGLVGFPLIGDGVGGDRAIGGVEVRLLVCAEWFFFNSVGLVLHPCRDWWTNDCCGVRVTVIPYSACA